MGKSEPEIELNDINKDGKYGEALKFDPEFKGPVKGRKCTDVPCCLLFIVFWIGMFIVAGYAFANGHPSRILKPTDSNGRICGEFYSGAEGDLRTKKYLYFFDITKCSATHINCAATPQVCVESCPTSTVAYGFGMTPEESICKYGFNATDNSLLGTYVSNGTCAPYLLASSSFFKRCVPTTSALSSTIVYDDNGLNITIASVNLTSAMYTLLNYFNAAEVSQQILADLDNSWYYLIAGCAVSLGLSYLYLIFLRFYSGCMVWSSIIISLVASIAATAYSFQLYKDRKSINDALPYQLHFNSYKYQEYTFLALAIVCAVIVVILLILILFLRTRIKIAIEIIREASKALVSMPLIVFFPFVTMGLVIALLMYWVWVGAFLTSSSTANYLDNNNTACTPPSDPLTPTNCSFYDYTTTQNLVNIQIYHLVGLLWTLNLISALGDCTIAGAIASWYWTRDHKGMPWFPIASAFKRTIIYHLGSLAFGSLIIAIVQLIRIGLEYIDRQTKNTQSQFMKFIIKCLKCCFWCLEKFIKFINTNAYIEIAVYGYSFCTAARKAFELLTRNIIRLALVNNIGDFLLFLGKMSVTCLTGIAAYIILDKNQEDFNYFMLPVAVITVMAYFIAKGFFSVFQMTISTIFLCFCEDCERNDGSPERPYYMSEKLQKLLGGKLNDKQVGN